MDNHAFSAGISIAAISKTCKLKSWLFSSNCKCEMVIESRFKLQPAEVIGEAPAVRDPK